MKTSLLLVALITLIPVPSIINAEECQTEFDKNVRAETCQGDSGHFSTNDQLIILWPHDDGYGLIKRYPPKVDADSDGNADDTKDNLIYRIWLKDKWETEKGEGSGFPLNLKTEERFNEFVNHLTTSDYGGRCIFDANGCKNTDGTLSVDSDIPADKQCDASFYITTCASDSKDDKTGPACTGNVSEDWDIGEWTPAASEVCTSVRRPRQTRTMTPKCEGHGRARKPAETRVITGGTKNCRECRRWEQGYQPRPYQYCASETFTMVDTITAKPEGCDVASFNDPKPAKRADRTGVRGRKTSGASITGTECKRTCSSTSWSPGTSSKCSGVKFTQRRKLADCSTKTRTAYGTKYCPPNEGRHPPDDNNNNNNDNNNGNNRNDDRNNGNNGNDDDNGNNGNDEGNEDEETRTAPSCEELGNCPPDDVCTTCGCPGVTCTCEELGNCPPPEPEPPLEENCYNISACCVICYPSGRQICDYGENPKPCLGW